MSGKHVKLADVMFSYEVYHYEIFELLAGLVSSILLFFFTWLKQEVCEEENKSQIMANL